MFLSSCEHSKDPEDWICLVLRGILVVFFVIYQFSESQRKFFRPICVKVM